MNKNLKLCIFGFGNAGVAFAKLLSEKVMDIREKYNVNIICTTVVTHSKGKIYDVEGLDLLSLCDDIDLVGKFTCSNGKLLYDDNIDILMNKEYDVLIDLTPLNIFTAQPSTEYIKTAMNNKKDIITANKGPIAWYYSELKELAKMNDVHFYYETTVMDGTPIFNLYDYSLMCSKVERIDGILNSTTNYILTELAQNRKLEEILENGKELGFIDTKPENDIDGWDAAAKICALLNVLMNANITPMDVDRTGISEITYKDIKKADKENKVYKLICSGYHEDGKFIAKVSPEKIEKSNPLAIVSGTSSQIDITTDLMGKISVIEHNPQILQTAYGIYSDLMRLLHEKIVYKRK